MKCKKKKSLKRLFGSQILIENTKIHGKIHNHLEIWANNPLLARRQAVARGNPPITELQERAVSTLLSTSIMPKAHGPWWSRMPVLNHRVSLCLQLEILRRLPCMASLSRAAPHPPHQSNPVLYWGHGTRVLSTWSPVYHAGLKSSFFSGIEKTLCDKITTAGSIN